MTVNDNDNAMSERGYDVGTEADGRRENIAVNEYFMFPIHVWLCMCFAAEGRKMEEISINKLYEIQHDEQDHRIHESASPG